MRIAGKEKGGVDYSCCFFFLCARIRGRDFVPREGGRKLLLGKFVEKFGDSPREGGRISPIGEFGIINCRRRCEERRNSRSNGDGGGAKGNGNGVGFRSRGTREVLFNLLCKRVTGCLPVENSRDGITHSAVEIRGGPPFVICPDETTGPGN